MQWFADHHIPVDYVAGASMGGLVGGFYATGMSPEDMRRLVSGLDWGQYVTAAVDDRRLSFRRKQDIQALGSETILGLREGLLLPTGINAGQKLDLLLSRIAAPYDPLRSFDDLPTPFRCVATDLVSARARVFEKGSLAEALRSTVSIPGLFDPIIDGNSEYVDGGLVNNLPVDLVKAMGADIVIAVYLATDPFDPHKPQTLVDVLSRSLSAVIADQERHNIEMADLLITANMSGLNTSDFAASDEMIRRGFAGADKKSTVLEKFSVGDGEWNEYLRQRGSKRKETASAPQFVEVTGVAGKTADTIRGYFENQVGQPFDADRIEAQVDRATGNRQFAYIAYDMTERDGKPGLSIRVRPAQSQPPSLQPGVKIEGSDNLISRFTIGGRLTVADLGGFRSELRNDFSAGSGYGFASEYFRPLTPASNWFIAPRVFANTQPLDFYRRSDVISLNRRTEEGGALDIGYQTGNQGEFRLGYEASHLTTANRLGDAAVLPEVSGRRGSGHLSYAFSNVDDNVVPHTGVMGIARMRWFDANPGSTSGFPVFDGSATWFRPLSKKSTLFARGAGGTTFNRTNSGVPLFYLGGPQRLSAYGLNELYGNRYFLARVGYMRQLAVLSSLTNDKVDFLVDYELGRMWDDPNSTRAPMDINAGFLVKTLLGPLFLGGSVGDSGHSKWYFQMGPVF